MALLELDNLTIGYGNGAPPIVEGLSLSIETGERISLLGPSGEGKTTILKAIAGLLPPTSGTIVLNGENLSRVPAEQRDIVMVFQKPLLFPSMTVGENVGFGLLMKQTPTSEIRKKVAAMLDRVGLSGFSDRKIHTLSGGQQQRVSLARALVLNPALLLLDEPFSSLDANLRDQMRDLLCDIQDALRVAMLLVTHDQSEALGISHRLGLLLGGTLAQFGTPEALYHHPETLDVARFFGTDNLVEGVVVSERFLSGSLEIDRTGTPDGPATLLIRPEDIRIHPSGRPAVVRATRFEGAMTRLRVDLEGHALSILTRENPAPGAAIPIVLPEDRIRIFSHSPEKESA